MLLCELGISCFLLHHWTWTTVFLFLTNRGSVFGDWQNIPGEPVETRNGLPCNVNDESKSNVQSDSRKSPGCTPDIVLAAAQGGSETKDQRHQSSKTCDVFGGSGISAWAGQPMTSWTQHQCQSHCPTWTAAVVHMYITPAPTPIRKAKKSLGFTSNFHVTNWPWQPRPPLPPRLF